jgi:hypothetical protein
LNEVIVVVTRDVSLGLSIRVRLGTLPCAPTPDQQRRDATRIILTRELSKHQSRREVVADNCNIHPERLCVMQGTQLNKGRWGDAQECGATFTLLADDPVLFGPQFGELNVTVRWQQYC